MTEGGLFAWNRQKIDMHRGPAGSYANLRNPLPPPPKDMDWIQDVDTHEWHLMHLIAVDGDKEDAVVVEAQAEAPPASPSVLLHQVSDTDTFAGICLRYKVSPTELRQANGFSGTNLLLAPNPLKIPVNDKNAQPTNDDTRTAQTTMSSPSNKVYQLRQLLPSLSASEARCYLELNDWDFHLAVQNAKEDGFGSDE
eukprot:Nitzschia sp. Nitz4//scaffold47_size129522//13411//13998//NITZ4_003535-RA/size129522-processed-gene-0.30-mRNA-1//-1//CDS//3329552752//7957//frame0